MMVLTGYAPVGTKIRVPLSAEFFAVSAPV